MTSFLKKVVRPPADMSTVPAPPETHNWRLYTMALSAAWASAAFGYDSAFIGGAIGLTSFKRRFGITTANSTAVSSHLTSLYQAGAFFGALLIYPITERFGRRYALMLAGVVFCIGALIQTVADGSIAMMYAGRVLAGLGIGSSSLVTPNYISECSTPAVRGRLIGLFEVMLQTALVIGFWVDYGVAQNVPDDNTNKQWQIPFGLQLVPGVMLIVCMAFQSESPRWLIKHGKVEQARKVLSRLRNLDETHEYIDYEIGAVQAQIRAEVGPNGEDGIVHKVKEMLGAKNRTRLGLGVALMWLQNLSGINALNYFSNSIIKGIGFTGNSVSLLATGVYGIIKMLVTLVFMFFVVDRVGRRAPLLVGSVGAALAMFYLGGFSIHTDSFAHPAGHSSAAYAGLAFVYIFAISYAFSWNGIPWIFCAEVFAMNVRALSMVVTTMAQWLSQFVIVYSAPYMIAGIEGWTFVFFGIWICVGAVFVYLFMPETKEISLEDMDILFAGPVLATKKRRHYEQVIAEKRAVDGQEGGMSSFDRKGLRNESPERNEKDDDSLSLHVS